LGRRRQAGRRQRPTCAQQRALQHPKLALQRRQPRPQRRRAAPRPAAAAPAARPAARPAAAQGRELPPQLLHHGARLAQHRARVALQAAAEANQVGAVVLRGCRGRRFAQSASMREPCPTLCVSPELRTRACSTPGGRLVAERAEARAWPGPTAFPRPPDTWVRRSSRCRAATRDTTGSTSGSTSAYVGLTTPSSAASAPATEPRRDAASMAVQTLRRARVPASGGGCGGGCEFGAHTRRRSLGSAVARGCRLGAGACVPAEKARTAGWGTGAHPWAWGRWRGPLRYGRRRTAGCAGRCELTRLRLHGCNASEAAAAHCSGQVSGCQGRDLRRP
jgi:hypothetical protein